MAVPNLSEIATTTIDSRNKKLTDNLTKNNVLWADINQKQNIRTFSGGTTIIEELSYQENSNFQWYSGYDQLAVSANDTISAAQFSIKQAAVSVVISGLDQLMNAGKEKMIDLLESRMKIAEQTFANEMAAAIYSDGTGFGGKQLTGLAAAVPVDPTTGTYGGIDRSAWTFWRPQLQAAGSQTASTIQGQFNNLWVKCVRGKDRPKLIVADNNIWTVYLASLQAQQRFTGTETGKLGFPSVKYMDADVVYDGGIGGFCPANSAFFLNTDYLYLRPHKDRNMKALSPSKRYAINQDAEVAIIAWAGNMTSSGSQFQGFFKGY